MQALHESIFAGPSKHLKKQLLQNLQVQHRGVPPPSHSFHDSAACSPLPPKTYLVEDEIRLTKAEAERAAQREAAGSDADSDDEVGQPTLVEIGGMDSGISCVVLAQLEAKVRLAALDAAPDLRLAALNVVNLILRQGLTLPMNVRFGGGESLPIITSSQPPPHALQCVPTLVALETDPDQSIRSKAKHQLQRLEERHREFVAQKAVEGSLEAYRFQVKLQTAGKSGVLCWGIFMLLFCRFSATVSIPKLRRTPVIVNLGLGSAVIRGCRAGTQADGNGSSAVLGHLYSLIRSAPAKE